LPTAYRFLAAIVSGLFLGLSQPKADLWPFAWFAWVPLILVVRGQSPKRVFQLAYAAHLTAFAVSLYWIEVVVRVFGSVPFFLSWIPLALLIGYLAAYGGVAFWGARKLEVLRPGFSMLWALPVFLTASEWLRGNLFTGFPWAHPAYSQYEQLRFIQASDVVGIDGLLFALASASVGIVAAVDIVRARKVANAVAVKQSVGILVVATVIVTAAFGYGSWRLQDVRKQMAAADDSVKVALVQGNVDQSQKWDRRFRETTLAKYETHSLAAAEEGANLVIWPETAAPFYFEPQFEDESSLRLVSLSKKMQTYLFFGAPAADYLEGKLRSFNRAYLLNREGTEIASYDKAHLVPFSEYIPLPWMFGWIDKLVPVVGNFATGGKRRALAIPGARFGPLICYESIFPEEVREFVDDGAQMLTIITNDAWFLRTSATYQHISMAALRAAENHVPVLQAGNTGVTAFIAADGSLQASLPIFEEGYLLRDVNLVTINSFYASHGEVFAYLILVVTGLLAVWGWRAGRLISNE
jgi:apolipoprotein N-acyltransferase